MLERETEAILCQTSLRGARMGSEKTVICAGLHTAYEFQGNGVCAQWASQGSVQRMSSRGKGFCTVGQPVKQNRPEEFNDQFKTTLEDSKADTVW